MTLNGEVKIVAFGDSITEGTYGGAHSAQTWTGLLPQLLNEKGLNTKIYNAGFPGETAPQGLRRFERTIRDKNPAIVLIMYGANDSYTPLGYDEPEVTISAFREALSEMITKARQNQVLPVLMTTTPFITDPLFEDEEQDHGAILAEYMESVRSLTGSRNVHLIDNFSAWLEKDPSGEVLKKYLPDGVHPNAGGNRLIAETIAPRLFEIIQ